MSTIVNAGMFTLLSVSTFKERLEEAARDKGVDVAKARADIQRLTGMSRSNMTHWWKGRAIEPKAGGIAAAAQYFGVNALWLAKNEGPKRDGAAADGGAWKMPAKFNALDPGEIEGILSMYLEMDSDVRGTWRRQGRDLLELMGEATSENPFGKGKRKPRKVAAKTARKRRSSS